MNIGRRLRSVLVILLIANILLLFVLLQRQEPVLKVTFLDIGQGDAILIRSPIGTEMLIDGGPDRSVLRMLPRELGLLDRHIEILLATHGDKDHIAGLTEVLNRYSVSYFLDSGARGKSVYARSLEDAVGDEPGIRRLELRRGMRLHLGGGVYADVLFPDRDVAGVEANTGSVALRLVYGATSFVLAGDLPIAVEDYITSLDGVALKSTVLKASHHGSKTSTSAYWLATVAPQVVVISAGKGNSYGHPSPEVIERVRTAGARIVSTVEEGSITFTSDGSMVRMQ